MFFCSKRKQKRRDGREKKIRGGEKQENGREIRKKTLEGKERREMQREGGKF